MNAQYEVLEGDCIELMDQMNPDSFDIIITSPPYNLKIQYNSYKDNKPIAEYLQWTYKWLEAAKRVMKPTGSLFLNVGGSLIDPWISFDVAFEARKLFTLQNKIVWVKSLHMQDKTYGHFKPIRSKRFLNDTHEFIFHFTKNGDVSIDRLAIGVPFSDQSNIERWRHSENKRCRGNTWFIPYSTIQNKGKHPAIFPVKLPEMCLKLHGIQPGINVLDPFGGTGSTLIACKKYNVHGTMIEIDRNYITIARDRLNKEDLCH